MTASDKPFSTQKAALVSRYATPLAVLLVALALICAQPQGIVRQISLIVLAISIVFNIGAIVFFSRRETTSAVIKFRMFVNVAMNAILVYFLGSFFNPIWLLLALTPVATAIYGTRRQTIFSAAGISILLLAIQFTRTHNSALDWGQLAAEIAFVVLLSLMINEISSAVRSQA